MFAAQSGRIFFAEDFDYVLSSTEVRSNLRANDSTEQMLPEKVRLYIEDHRLYR